RLSVRRDGFDATQDSARQGARCKISARHEPHQWAEAPGGGSSQEVKAFNGRLVAMVESWIAVDDSEGLQQGRWEEGISRNVHTVANGHEDVIHLACGAVVQGESQAATLWNG